MAVRGQLQVATCQFSVSARVSANARTIRAQMRQSRRLGADIVHFPETALAGYAGVDYKTWEGFDWALYTRELKSVLALAKRLRLWVVLGGAHRLTGDHKPHNCLYVITPQGRILDRYDKRFCTKGDLDHYSPGDHFVTFVVNDVTCGLLICYDLRFPELYRAYKKLGVDLMFHSFYNARGAGQGIWSEVMRPTAQGHAGINYMWISMNNAAGYYQQWASVLIQPDGRMARSLRQHRAGVMVNVVDVTVPMYRAVGEVFTQRALRGDLCSAPGVRDRRSRARRTV